MISRENSDSPSPPFRPVYTFGALRIEQHRLQRSELDWVIEAVLADEKPWDKAEIYDAEGKVVWKKDRAKP